MAIASQPTKLPLATWAKILGVHPLHFEQVSYTPTDRSQALCDQTWFQHSWQEGDRVSREEVAAAIAEAEEMMERQLGFHLLPVWDADEWHMAQRSWQPELHIYTRGDIRGYATGARAKWGWFRSGGIEAKTLIDDAVAIVWSDTDNDGLDDTGTVSVTVTAGQDECEVEAYYPGHDGDAAYQIRPISVSISGITATITFKRELCVLESLQEALTVDPVEYADDGSFLTTVDVYRHYNDPSQQATIMWSPSGTCAVCGNAGCDACQYSTQTACLHLRSSREASFIAWSPATWDADEEAFTPTELSVLGRMPDILRYYYRSGWQSKRGCSTVMDPAWARAVAYLSVSLLDRPMCDCTTNVWEIWHEDLAVLSGGEQSKTYSFSARDVAANNPFGMRRGAIYAWQRVNDPDVAAVRSAILT